MHDALREHDLPEAAGLLATEGWTFTPRELSRILATGPGLSVALHGPRSLQGVLTVARHGDLAWVGNVVVAPELRGRGAGAALVGEALRRIDRAGIRTTKLCSVPKAVTLYARLGFRAERTVRTYTVHHDRPTHRPREAEVLLPDDLPELAALDRRHFGADRTAVLRMWMRDYPDTGVALRRDGRIAGYAFLKPGPEGTELGPVVLDDAGPEDAGALLDAALGFRLAGPAAGVECSTGSAHPWMGAQLEKRGFAGRDQLGTLMARGAPLAQDWVGCAALGGLEKG